MKSIHRLVLAGFVLLLGLTGTFLGRADGPRIEVTRDRASALGSPVLVERARERLDGIDGLTEEQRQALDQGLRNFPEHRRWFDATLAIYSGYPDTFAFCLDGFPVNELEIEACAGIHLAIVSLSLGLRYRFDLLNERGVDGAGPQLTLGPGLSYRHMERCPFGPCASSNGVDFVASLEFTQWLSAHFGLQVEADLGLGVQWTSSAPGSTEEMLHPIGRLMIGIAH